jgi:hypothetical protein
MYRLGFVLAIAIVSLIAATPAGAVLPPGNSAANQYTEAYPTGGGNQPAGRGGRQTPAGALGKENARKLEGMGPEGAAAAQLAAETAPGGGASQTTANQGRENAGEGPSSPSGSSGLSSVIGQATGSSDSGELGWGLPLIFLGALLGSAAYALHRRGAAD